jgi:hypothetical protein
MTDLIPWDQMLPAAQGWTLMKQQAGELIKSGFLPAGIKTPEQAVAIMLKGRELGIPPMQALSHIHIINGKPTMSAELMLAQIMRLHPKTKISYPVRSAEKCEVKVTREGSEASVFSFSIQDAQAAGLLSNPTWKKYPRAMLHARVVSEMARSLFPDAISGVSYTPEEMGASVNEDGQVIEVESREAVVVTPSKHVVAEAPAAPVAVTPVSVETFTRSPTQLRQIAAFLTSKGQLKSLDTFCSALDGKEFTRTNINAAWDAINPEAPDKAPEGA